jgi:glycosyltransferase involved in cell wall biosynthesis
MLDLHDLGLRQTGNESWARSLSSALLALDGPGSYDVAVTSLADPDDLRRLAAARETVRISRSSVRRLGADLPMAMRRLRSSALLVQYTAPLTSVPAVVTVHDLSFEDDRAREWLPLATRLRYRASVRLSVRRAAHVVVDSEYTRQDLLTRYRGTDPERMTVVPLAVDPEFADLLRATPADRDGGPPVVLVVGNVLPRKNVAVVARAVRLMRDRGSEAVLRIVGAVHPGGQADADLARQLLGDAVTVTGYVSSADLATELRRGHVLAFPSLYEGFGIPALEAMAAGVPVVVSDRTSLPEVVGDAGLVVPAEDAEAWAEALQRALEPAESARLVTAGERRVTQLTWDASARLVSAALRRASC